MNNEQKQKVFKLMDRLRNDCYRDLQAEEASNILLKLSSLYGILIELAVDAEMTYNRQYSDLTEQIEKVTEARAKAKASPEYEEMLRMQGRIEVTRELIRSLKYLLKVKLDEKNESVY